MNDVEVVALCGVLWLLFSLRRSMMAMLRVLRRIDRKTADTTASDYRRQAEPNEARIPVTESREPQPKRPVAG
jgi:hypothetical protein